MPEVRVSYPAGTFTPEELQAFKDTLKQAVASEMDAINPLTGERTDFCSNPQGTIDLVMSPYGPESEVTAQVLVTIITYNWPDRMCNIQDRLRAIGLRVMSFVPPHLYDDQDLISFTFLGKQDGCWHAVSVL